MTSTVLSTTDPQVKKFVDSLNRSLSQEKPPARLENVQITIDGKKIDTQIQLVPLGAITSAEDWNKVSQFVERKVMGFASIYLEAMKKVSKTKGKGKPPKTVGEKMARELKEFGKSLRKGEVEWIDPEDVVG